MAHSHDDHNHDPGCNGGLFRHHHHEVTDYNRAFAIGTALNILFVVIEADCAGWPVSSR